MLSYVLFGLTSFCANGHAQLCQYYCVIQSDTLIVYNSPAHLLFLFTFLFQHGISFRDCLSYSIVQSLCNLLILIYVLLQMLLHL